MVVGVVILTDKKMTWSWNVTGIELDVNINEEKKMCSWKKTAMVVDVKITIHT